MTMTRVVVFLVPILLLVAIYMQRSVDNRVDSLSVQVQALKERVLELEASDILQAKIQNLASYERNRLMDGLISVFNTTKASGIFDGKRPKIKMIHCESPLVPTAIIE